MQNKPGEGKEQTDSPKKGSHISIHINHGQTMIFHSKRRGLVKTGICRQATVFVNNYNLMRKPNLILVCHLDSQLFVKVAAASKHNDKQGTTN